MAQPQLPRGDIAYLRAVHAAREVEATPGAVWSIYLMLAILASAVTWAALSKVDMVTRAEGRVVPDGHEQVIASLEGGILRQMLVHEGELVQANQALAHLDPTRFEAQQNEGQAKRLSLRAAIVRLRAEATGKPLAFDADMLALKSVVMGETEAYRARQFALDEAVAMNRRNLGLLTHELKVAEGLSAKGLMSEVEVMRVRRQVNDLNLQTQERINRFRQDASSELVRLQTELAQVEEQMVVRDDVLKRTVLRSPVRGMVKNIKANTLGGVVSPGGAVMEIVPLGPRVVIEARIKPADIGFLQLGQAVEVKLSAYESTLYGTLHGTVQSISPDALGDPDRQGPTESTYYRAVVLADASTFNTNGKPLSVLPGMTGTAEIKVGQRSVLSFMLRPLLKANEAFRER